MPGRIWDRSYFRLRLSADSVSRRAKPLLLLALLLLALAAIWVAGGFLWPRPQFDRPGTPWNGRTPVER